MNCVSDQVEVDSPTCGTASSRIPFYQAAFLAALIAFLYHGIMARLVYDWWTDANFSYAFFVPLFSAFVVWQSWQRLARLPLKPSWFGLAVIAGALGVLVVGVLGAELFLARSSFVLLLAGLLIHFMGWLYFRKVIFPWACLFLMVPIPAIIFNQIAFPLQLLASRFASAVLVVSGVPVLLEGNVIELPAMRLEVAQACSGIRSLMSLLTLAIIYGYLLEPKALRRVLLGIAAIPIAIASNSLRIVGTGLLVHYWDPDKAKGFFHAFEGWVVFVLSLVILFAFHELIRLAAHWRAGRSA